MRRRSPLLRIAKWGGVVVCGLILLVFLISGSWWFSYLNTYSGGLFRGRLWIGLLPADVRVLPRWSFGSRDIGFDWWFDSGVGAGGMRFVDIPLWVPFVIVTIPTAILWRLDRRPISGHCPCGYDLTGNLSGTCPECGRKLPA